MIVLLVTAVSSLAAAAAGCPDFSGSFQAAEDGGVRHELTLRQSGCERIEFTHAIRNPVGTPEITRETWLLDGRCRSVPESPELCISREIRRGVLAARGQLKLIGHATRVRRFEQRLRLEGGALVSEAAFYDLLGGLEEEHRMRYTPAHRASAREVNGHGASQKPVDARKVPGP